jgi:hypothetical protein
VLPAARWPVVLPQSFSAIVLASSQAPAAGQAQATSHPNCRLVQAVEPTLDARDNPAVVGLAILVALDNRATGQATLAARDDPVIAQVISVALAAPAIARGTSAALVDPAIGLATLADRANRAESLFRIFPAASAIAKDGKTGARIIVTTSGTGGRTTPATSTIGSTTAGGTTTTSIGRTIRDSVTGDGRHGTG